MFQLEIVLPERRINLAKDKAVLDYLLKECPFAEGVMHSRVLQSDPLVFQLILSGGSAQIPLTVSRRQGVVHFGTTVTELNETQAILVQTHMWSKQVGLNLVYPYPMKNSPETVAFTVSGGLPANKLRKSNVDAFLVEFVSTCMFVLQCVYELGPKGPPSANQTKPGWVQQLAQQEAEGPRRSEFVIDPPPEVSQDPSPNTPPQEDSADDHPNQ